MLGPDRQTMGPDPYSDDSVNIDESARLKQQPWYGMGPFGSRRYPMGYTGQDPDTLPPPKIWVALLQSFLLALLVLAALVFLVMYYASHYQK